MAKFNDQTLFDRFRQESNSILPPGFQQRYVNGELPITLVKEGFGHSVRWLIPFDILDFSYYLPIFFDGLMENENPAGMIADLALHEMISKGGEQVIFNLPNFIVPLCRGLTSINPDVLVKSLIVLQHVYDVTGLALYPYYDKIMPILNELIEKAEYIETLAPPSQLKKGYFGKMVLNTIHHLQQGLYYQ